MTAVDRVSDVPQLESVESRNNDIAYERGCAKGLDILAGALAVASTVMLVHDLDARWVDSAIGYSGSLYLARYGYKLRYDKVQFPSET